MVGGWDATRSTGHFVGGEKLFHVSFDYRLFERVVEGFREAVRFATGALRKICRTEVVHHVSSTNDEASPVSKIPELPADFVVLFGRRSRVDGQGRYRYVGIREKMDERSPNSVVETAFDGFPDSPSENFVEVFAYRRISGCAV